MINHQAVNHDPLRKIEIVDLNQNDFTGDQIDKNHEALWDIEKFVSDRGGWPTIFEKQDIVIVGGGMSGLISAYLHSNNKPVVLELDEQFGGNSKGEIFNNHQMSVGVMSTTQKLNKKMTVLTAYCPLPFDGARQFLFNPLAYEKYKKAILSEISHYAPILNLDSRFIHDIRIQRWGHSLSLAKTNFFSSNDYKLVNHSFTNRIHFANQDNYINPAFESAFAAAECIELMQVSF